MDEARVRELGLDPVRDDLDPGPRRPGPQRPAAPARPPAAPRRPGRGRALRHDRQAATPTRYLPYLEQSGLGLPDESYYRDESFAEIRQEYVAHIGRMLSLAGIDADGAPERIMALETRLASAHWDRVRSRDAVATLQRCSTGTACRSWLPASTGPRGSRASRPRRRCSTRSSCASRTSSPPSPRPSTPSRSGTGGSGWPGASSAAARRTSVTTWPTRASPSTAAPSPARPSRRSAGSAASTRWSRRSARRSASSTSSGTSRRRPRSGWTTLVANLVEAYRRNIDQLDWMSAETKVRAEEKLARFMPKIGYPDQWRDYSTLQVDRDDLLGNVRAGAAFETDRELGKLGGPVDRDRVAHDAADGQRLLQPGDERDRLPRRHPAAAVLRPRGRGRPSTTARSVRSSATRSVTGSTTRARGTTARATSATGGPSRTASASTRSPRPSSPSTTRSSRASCPVGTSTARSPSARTSATSAASRSPTRRGGSPAPARSRRCSTG